MLYRKKPVVINAYDFTETKVDEEGKPLYDGEQDGVYYIDTLEGRHNIREDDFVIVGVEGERYPCKRSIFIATYDKVSEC
jgi:hypothetical protein